MYGITCTGYKQKSVKYILKYLKYIPIATKLLKKFV